MEYQLEDFERYLESRSSRPIRIQEVAELGKEAKGAADLKRFGYGRPFLIAYRSDGREERLVFHRIRRNAFGREREDDRDAAVWLDFRTFNRLPRHVPALDLVLRTAEGIRSIAGGKELLLVTAYRPGRLYAEDLLRLQRKGIADPLDFRRASALARYLARIHRIKHGDPLLWRRRLRDLVGHGEGIMGLTDSYSRALSYVDERGLRELEESANRWRWRLKALPQRLSQVHGDFHPFNILFEEREEFHLLDRSRGEWGEPADDVSCISINYLFFSLQNSGRIETPFRKLHDKFWERYFALRQDEELLYVIQPWLAWRALVLASPIWYPDLSEEVRRKILTFARRVMASERYDYHSADQYFEEEA
jgi:Phosphotransferase enzyme family